MPIKYDPNRFQDMANDNAMFNPDAAKAAAANALNELPPVFGHGPQIYGAVKNPIDALRALLNPSAQTPQNNAYIGDRDAALRYLEQANQKYPNASLVGRAAGVVGSAVAPGMALEPAAGALGRAGRAALVGAGYGALHNPGDVAGKAQGLQLEDRAIDAGIGGTVSGTVAGAGEILGKLGAKAANFNPAQAEAYRANPKGVKSVAKASDLENAAKAEALLNDTSEKLRNRTFDAGGLEDQLQAQLGGKTVPEADLAQAGSFAPKAPQSYINDQLQKAGFGSSYQNIPYDELPAHAKAAINPRDVPLGEVYQAARTAGTDSTRWTLDPIDGSITKATNEPAADAWKFLRGKVVGAAPEAEGTIGQIKQGIDAQQGVRAGFNRPIAFIKSGAPDTGAARQAADALTGGKLSGAADEFSAGYQMKTKKGSGLMPFIGRAGITASKAAAPISYAADRVLQPFGGFVDVQANPDAPPRAPAKYDPNRFEPVE